MNNTIKTILAIAIIALVIAGAVWLVKSKGQEPVKGTIMSVDLSGIALDGPAVVTISLVDGSHQEIHVPSFGLMLCPARENIADVYALQAGDEVEVRGERNEDGAIVPCSDEEHFLRVISQESISE